MVKKLIIKGISKKTTERRVLQETNKNETDQSYEHGLPKRNFYTRRTVINIIFHL